MREIAHNWISPVHIKVDAYRIASVATARQLRQKTAFFDSIDPIQTPTREGCVSVPGNKDRSRSIDSSMPVTDAQMTKKISVCQSGTPQVSD
jgi:hypothetical protein